MAPDLPRLGPRAQNAFGQRTGVGLAADLRDAITAATILENQELENNTAKIEEILNEQRNAAGLPPHAFSSTHDAMYEVCRGYRDTLEALLQKRKTSEKAYKEKNDLEKSQLTDKIAVLEATISREKSKAKKYNESCREAWQDTDGLREELSRAHGKVMEQDKKITDNAISREKQVGEYREAIGVLKERLANKKSAADDFEKEKKRLKMELDDLHGSYKESLREKENVLAATAATLREKEDIQKKALEAIKAEFEKELKKLRDESSAGQKSELLNLREKLEAASRDKTQLESENVDIKRQLGELRAEFQLSELRAGRARETQLETDRANIERQLNELRSQRDQEAHAIPVRLTPSSPEEPRGRATPVAVPSFSGALMGPPESTPSSRRKGSALENPKEKMFRMYSSPAATPYTSPYGSRETRIRGWPSCHARSWSRGGVRSRCRACSRGFFTWRFCASS